VPSQQLIIPY